VLRVLNPEAIARAKLRVEVRFRHLKAGRPDKWGEQSTIITKSGDNYSNMSTEDLEKSIADVERKSGIVRKVA
jgi:hypothetical protein